MEKNAENIYGALRAALNNGYYQGEWQRMDSPDAELLLSVADGFKNQIKKAEHEKNTEVLKTLTDKQQAFNNILFAIVDLSYYADFRENFNVLLIKNIGEDLKKVLRQADMNLNPQNYRDEINQQIIDENIEKLR